MNESQMLDLLKALTDADRLRIIGVLTRNRANVQEIAGRLNLPFRDVFNHLAFLEFVGVVKLSDNLYELQTDKLKELARQELGPERAQYTPAPDLDEVSRKVLAAYLNPDGSIRQIPVQKPAKLKVILDYLIQAFTPGVDYTEREVNQIIARFHEDTSGLRRDLVDAGLLARISDGSRYWRVTEHKPGRPE
jgi:hypothetical protein